ncbi:mitochondrial carrier domain-containing protein [Blastocladiella britannica]|nr:mitochondrial carrier domain-containing protein [Blastocladiella britannica]
MEKQTTATAATMTRPPPPPPLTPPPAAAAPPTRSPMTFEYACKSFFAGGIAGCAAKSVVAPLDRVKILFQTNAPHYSHHRGSWQGVFRAIHEIRGAHGIPGLFQGHSATLLRIFPYAAIKFMANEQYKHLIFPTATPPTPLHSLLAGSLAGVTSVFFTYPLEVIRVRLAFSPHRTTFPQLLRDMYAEPAHMSRVPGKAGKMTNYFRGFMPTVYGMIPYAGVSFMTYDTIKERLRKTRSPLNPDQPLKPWAAHLIAGGLAGMISQTVSYPFEVVRRRMQVSGHYQVDSFEARAYKSTMETASYIYQRNGWRGFFVGLGIGYLKVVPMSMVSFWTYEAVKSAVGI